jgi:hypothetical protein
MRMKTQLDDFGLSRVKRCCANHLPHMTAAHRVNLLPSTNVNQIHSSAKLAQQIEDSSLVLAPLTFTWLQCPQPSISVGSSDTKEDPIDLSVQFQCDVLSRISSGPPAGSFSFRYSVSFAKTLNQTPLPFVIYV